MSDALPGFSKATRAWFQDTFDSPTDVQARGWSVLQEGRHALLLAPTGSGKTLAAMLAGIDRATRLLADAPAGVRVLYVSPLKALVHDVERNLRSPLVGILRTAERLEETSRAVRVDVRTGDTPQRERMLQRKNPAEILVTTPESLFLILGSQARETLRTVETVIVDEVHALAGTKRGAHLALSLERLAELTESEPQRVGLSATVRPAEEVARFLGGDRDVEIVDAAAPPALDLEVVVPVPDMDDVRASDVEAPAEDPPSGPVLGHEFTREAASPEGPPGRRVGVWPAVYPRLVDLVRSHRSTIVFVNSRGLAERLSAQINELAEEELVLAHHGSVSRDQRTQIEEALKRGELAGIVATSSLELGIDMGAVDLVVLVESPGSVARGLQRVGRAGHAVGERSRGLVFPKFKGDLLECAALGRRMLSGELESIAVPENALDVLAQQLVAMVVDRDRSVDELEALVTRAYGYRGLSRGALEGVLDMLSGRYPSDEFADLRPRLAWDRTQDVLTARRGAAMVVRMNAGTIPDRGLFHVHAGHDGPRIGELDEEMVNETKSGDVILLGASSWRVAEITRDRVVVEPAPGETGRLPFWRGDGLGRPVELGRATGALVRELEAMTEEGMREHALATTPLDELAAQNLASYVAGQREHSGVLPTDRTLVIERFRDELGDWRVCILSPFGKRVHAPWAMALQTMLSARSGYEVSAMYTDDGIVLTFADGGDLPNADELLPNPDELEDLVLDQLGGSALFGATFRENASRALLLPRRSLNRRTPLFLQRLKSKALLAAVSHHPEFPIVLETYRQCLRDVFDLGALEGLLRGVRDRTVRVEEVETRGASPMARSLVFSYVAAYLYEYDAPLAERRTQALTLDRNLLRELLGEAELRDLLDAEAIDEVERALQFLVDDRRARDLDEVSDVLRRLGALSVAELRERIVDGPSLDGWLVELRGQRRAAVIRVAGEERWIAAEDAGLYRDALGASPPTGLPDAFLASVPNALEVLVARHARTHGPFRALDVASRLGLREAQVRPGLEALAADGRLVRGAIDPRHTGPADDWCDDDVLRRIKRATLARLRGEVAAVEAATLGRFLPAWQGLDERRHEGRGALELALAQLEGVALSWSEWVTTVLPARVSAFEPGRLDELCARGEIVWVGRGALGARDGRVAFFRRASAALLLEEPPEYEAPFPLHAALLDALRQRGASFTTALERVAREVDASAGPRDFEAALWDLVWAGLVTNDTCMPLRHFQTAGAGGGAAKRRRRGGSVLAGGRWSLVQELVDPSVAPTERSHAWAGALLERHGIVSRDAVAAEELPGGFSRVYPVLKAMEEAGRVRRGHFVEGLGGAQFALPGAVDRLRDVREVPNELDVRVLAAVDPASPWGAVLPWPEGRGPDSTRPRRAPGATVVLVDGTPAAYLGPGGRALLTFVHPREGEALAAALGALATLPGKRRRYTILKIDGDDAHRSTLQPALERAGFALDYRGWGPR